MLNFLFVKKNSVVVAEFFFWDPEFDATQAATKPALPLLMTKEQVNAVTKNIGAAYVASAEGDMLQSLQKDPESLKAAQAYLKKNLRK